MRETLRLFRALPIHSLEDHGGFHSDIAAITIPYGFIFAPEVFDHYDAITLMQLSREVIDVLGLSGGQMNKSFHKGWHKVATASDQQLILEQILHYLTTYGFERLGIYNENTVYIPKEELNIPNLLDHVKLMVIKGYTLPELKEKLLTMLNVGFALHEDTVKDVVAVAELVGLTEQEVKNIKNREVKIAMFSRLGFVPEDPLEFLRLLVYKCTGKTLLIKNKDVFKAISNADGKMVADLFESYCIHLGNVEKLASVFYRFKPLFLAARKTNYKYRWLKGTINRIRKEAKVNHRPMLPDMLNDVTGIIKREKAINLDYLWEALDGKSIFRKARLAQALAYRTDIKSDCILYKIRNGKGFAADFKFDSTDQVQEALMMVEDSIADDLRPAVFKKNVYIPENLTYAIPTSEKQFVGMFPCGTYVTTPTDLIFGIYWENINGHRIDLDLSLLNASQKFGWDGYWRNKGGSLLFSGDMTDAQNGASELYYISKNIEDNYIVFCNFFNFDPKIKVPMKIVTGAHKLDRLPEGYVIDPNHVLAMMPTHINEKQKCLGLVEASKGQCKFYFSEFNLGTGISSRNSKYDQQARAYLINYHRNMVNFNNILLMAGAALVNDPSYADIDLSPERLEKDTFIKLLASGV